MVGITMTFKVTCPEVSHDVCQLASCNEETRCCLSKALAVERLITPEPYACVVLSVLRNAELKQSGAVYCGC